MKNRLMKKIIIFALLLFTAGVFSACGGGGSDGKNVTARFTQNSMIVACNHEFSIEEYVDVIGGEYGDVKFISSNPEVIFVKPTNIFVSSNPGVALITIENIPDEYMEITVQGADVKFPAPSNIMYNQSKNSVVWDAVYSEGVVASNYEITITDANGDSYSEIINTNSYEIVGSGEYVVVVKAMRAGYIISDPSPEYRFAKLESPTNLEYNDDSGILSWNADEYTSNFKVKINKVYGQTISATNYNLDLSKPGSYEISVMSCASAGQTAFGAESQEVLKLTRLKTPELSVVDGKLTWNDTQNLTNYFDLRIEGPSPIYETVENNGTGLYEYSLEDLYQGEYNIYIQAHGDVGSRCYTAGTHYLDGEQSSVITVKKLTGVSVEYNKSLNKVYIPSTDAGVNGRLILEITLDGEIFADIDISQSREYTPELTQAGVYEFTVINTSTNENEISSNSGNTIRIVKLAEAQEARHNITDGKYYIENYEVTNAEDYLIEIIYSSGGSELITTYSVADNNVEDLFSRVGTYNIRITASNTDAGNTYYLTSVFNSNLQVFRPSNCVLSVDTEHETINWESVSNLESLVYAYSISGDGTYSGILTSNSFAYGTLGVGTYTIDVWATTSSAVSEQTIILDSKAHGQVEFSVYKTIATPNVVWARDGERYLLNIKQVLNATVYDVYFNEAALGHIEITAQNATDEYVSYEITSTVNGLGTGENFDTYNFAVIARNTESVYYYNSSARNIKALRATAPTRFSLTATEEILTSTSEDWYGRNKVLIKLNTLSADEIETNSLSTGELAGGTEYVVKIKYVANTRLVGEYYYIDSYYTSFILQRKTATVTVENEKIKWATESLTGFREEISIKQGGINQTVVVTNDEYFDLLSLPARNFNLVQESKIGFRTITDSVNGSVSGVYVGGVYVDNAKDNNPVVPQVFKISSNSIDLSVKYADETIGIDVSENNSVVTISWQSKVGATYDIYGTNNYTVNSNMFDAEVVNYFALEENLDDSRFVYLFTITRYPSVASLVIDESENISTTNVPVGATLVKTINNTAVNNLTTVADTATVVAKFGLTDNSNSHTNFKLCSYENSFTFKRLPAYVNAIRIIADKMYIEKENDGTDEYVYVVKFYDSENASREIEMQIDQSSTNIVDFGQDFYHNIIDSLGSIKYYSINKKASETTCGVGETFYLSSGFNAGTRLKVLEAPTNVMFELLNQDYGQKSLRLKWTMSDENAINGFLVSGYKIKISYGGDTSIIETEGYYTIDGTNANFNTAGTWTVSVQAIGGNNDTITSNYSEAVTFVRLASTSSINISNGGNITWAPVDNVSGYVVVYKDFATDGTVLSGTRQVDASTTSYQLTAAELASVFDGEFDVTVYAIGDGQTYFSSQRDTSFTREIAPDVQLKNDRVVFQNYDDYSVNTIINLSASINGHEVVSTILQDIRKDGSGQYSWVYPENYSYLDGSGELVYIDFTTSKDIVYKFSATNSTSVYFNSNTVQKQATILANLVNPRIARDNTTDNLHFYIDNPNLEVTLTKLIIAGDINMVVSSTVDYELTEGVLGALPTDWQFRCKACGGVVNDIVYIDGLYTTVSGTKLATTTNITTNSGAVVWDSVTNARDYKTLIDNATTKINYALPKETFAGVTYTAGAHTIAVKSLSYITSTPVTDNFVLDSDYSAEYTITKLEQITNINVQKGFFTFDEVDNADEYRVLVYSNLAQEPIAEYELTQFVFTTDHPISYYHNTDFIELLSDGNEYYVKFYAKATSLGYITSDISEIEVNGDTDDYLIVEQFVDSDNEITLSHPTNNDIVDYTKTYATFKQNIGEQNGYIIYYEDDSSNVEKVLKQSSETSVLLDVNGTWEAGAHIIRYVQLGTSGIPNTRKVFLTRNFEEGITVTKLAQPTVEFAKKQNAPNNNFLKYGMVESANSYYCYFNNNLFGTYTTAGTEIDVTSLNSGLYNSFGVKAVNTTNINYVASKMCYLTVDHGNNALLAIRKFDIPSAPSFEDGVMFWELTDEQLLTILEGGFINAPFFADLFCAENERISIKFTNLDTGATYEYYDNLIKFVKITDTQIETMSEIDEAYGEILADYKNAGFPSLNYSFKDFAQSLPVGEYNIQYKIIGDFNYFGGGKNVLTLSSEYSEPIRKYISAAPEIRIENNNDVFNLKFKNVTVNTDYFGGAKGNPTYVIVLTYQDEEENPCREILAEVNASGVNDSSTLVLNLSNYVDSELLTYKHTGIYVYVKGNDTNGVLNGKCSNELPIVVLKTITANINRGVVEWLSQERASKYVITYNGNVLNVPAQYSVNTYEWLCEQLIANQEYEIDMYAYGTQVTMASENGVTVISGKVTELGRIVKLSPVGADVNSVNIVNGVYTWLAIANATSYDVFVTSERGNLGDYIALNNTPQYETQVTNNEVNYYYFRAVGTVLLEGLNENSFGYVNSEISPVNAGIRLAGIEDLSIINGIITWTSSSQDVWFKLRFNRVNAPTDTDETISDAETVSVYLSYQDIAVNGVCYYDTNECGAINTAGYYLLRIQAYYPAKTQMGTDTGVYYLISQTVRNEESIYKFNPVSDIQVVAGTVSWTHDEYVPTYYYYRLRFTYVNDYSQTIEQVLNVQHQVGMNGGTCDAVVFEGNIQNKAITLYIMVMPGTIGEDCEENYFRSIEVQYGQEIHQFNKIDESTILIDITQNGSLQIGWDAPVGGNSQDIYYYEVYYETDTELTGTVTTSDTYVICAVGQQIPIDIQAQDAYLYFKIRLVPPRNSVNQISSWWTELRKVEKPTGVDNFEYDDENYEFAWDRYDIPDFVQNSVYYKIKDEVGHYIGEGSAKTFIPDSIYIIDADLGDENFTPFAIGVHRVSVAVIIRNSSGGDVLMSNYCEPILCDFDLFDRGVGTEENPYIITTEVQFHNIIYRLSKDPKNNSYYSGVFTNGQFVINEQKTTLGAVNQVYHFKQEDHIVVTPNYVIVDDLASTYYEFNGNYNGDFYSLKLAWNTDITAGSNITFITLFERVGANGTLQNINVKLDLTSSATLQQIAINKVLEIAVLARENYGVIKNIAVGKGEQIPLDVRISENSLKLTFITSANAGEVLSVENFYNINIVNNGNMAAVEYATFVLNNNRNGLILGAKNCGNITVNAYTAHVGGVVEFTAGQSRVESVANIGNIYVFLRKNSSSNIGGIIAKNDGATINYCYVVGDITVVSGENNLTSPLVGGIIGDSIGDNINYSYTNVTKNINVVQGSFGYDGIYQVIGNLITPTGCNKVYYKAQSGFNAVKSASVLGGYVSYVTSPTEIADNLFFENSGFERGFLDEFGNPRLAWEYNYDELIWQN